MPLLSVMRQPTKPIAARQITVAARRNRAAVYPLIQLSGPWLADLGLLPGVVVAVTPRVGGFDVRVRRRAIPSASP